MRSRPTSAPRSHTPTYLMSKVPEVSAVFWIAKILTTGMGETASDFLVRVMPPIAAVALAGACFVGALALQFSARRYIAWVYWLAVVMVSVFGTMAADVMHVVLGVPYWASTAGFVVVLAIAFAAWYASERTLSIHSIHTRRRESFYWAAVLATFALGTALGDMTAVTLHLGYFASGILFAVLIAIPALAYWRLRLNGIVAFWAAYVVTRPLGASFADWAAVSHARGGLGLGSGWVTLVAAMVVAGFVGYLQFTHTDVEPEPAE